MLSKEITYIDYNGVECTETFYFNLSKSELLSLQTTYPGGYAEHLDRVVKRNDPAELMALFKDLIHMTYGVKSEDGKRFVKNEEVVRDFESSPAYDQLFMELATNDEVAADFVIGVFPKEDLNGNAVSREELLAKTKALTEAR